MPGNLQPLGQRFPIVNPDGTPTLYFIEWAQQKQIDISAGITAAQAQQLIDDWAAARSIIAGNGLDGGGPLSADVTIDANASAILNLLSSTQGTVLYRGASTWAGLAPGTSGHFLKTNGAAANPEWAAGGGGGSAAWTIVASYDQAIDGSVANFDSPDLSSYNELFVQFDNVNSSVARVLLLLSTDGSTFHNTSGDYADVAASGAKTNNAALFGNTTSASAVRSSSFHIFDIAKTLPERHIHLPIRNITQVFKASTSPILKVRAVSTTSAGAPSGNITAGTITMLAR